MDPSEISACEKMVMKAIWENDSEGDMALQEVMNYVNTTFQKEWKPQTVSTFLARLVRKEFLTSYRKGRYTYYQPLVQQEDFKRSTIQEDVKFFDQGNVAAYVCSLCDSVKLTEEDKKRIKKKIDELD